MEGYPYAGCPPQIQTPRPGGMESHDPKPLAEEVARQGSQHNSSSPVESQEGPGVCDIIVQRGFEDKTESEVGCTTQKIGKENSD